VGYGRGVPSTQFGVDGLYLYNLMGSEITRACERREMQVGLPSFLALSPRVLVLVLRRRLPQRGSWPS
jgi:hypothetical protein